MRAVVLLILGGWVFGSGLPSGKVRVQKGIAKFWAPNRLEEPFERNPNRECIRIAMWRYYPWYRFDAIGSNTPIREALYIAIRSPQAAPDACDNWARYEAREHVKPVDWVEISWKQEMAGVKEKLLVLAPDPPVSSAEGIYTVNTRRDKVVVVEMKVPEKNAMIAYRVWRSDANLAEAKKIVQEVARTLTYDAPLEEVFRNRKVEED